MKQEKREIKRQIQLVDGVMKEDLYTAYYAVLEDEGIVADRESKWIVRENNRLI